MSFSSGTFSINTAGQPVVTGTVISSTAFNTLTADLATGLSTCVLKDGTQTMTANIPMSSFKLTGLAAGSTAGDSVRYEQLLGLPAIGTARQVPTVNSGATALAFQNPITLATKQVTTSGTSIDFTGIPAGVRRITVMLNGVSVSGTSSLLIQIGDSGGIENTGYLSIASFSGGDNSYTTGFGITSASATNVIYAMLTLGLQDISDTTWLMSGTSSIPAGTIAYFLSGVKATSAVLDRVRLTTVNGSDTFDLGSVNISYE